MISYLTPKKEFWFRNLAIWKTVEHTSLSRYRENMPSTIPDSKVHGANTGPTWVLSAPDGPHVGPMNLAIRDNEFYVSQFTVWIKIATTLRTIHSDLFSWRKTRKLNDFQLYIVQWYQRWLKLRIQDIYLSIKHNYFAKVFPRALKKKQCC